MPSVLWRCWLGDRKGIRPVKTEWWVLVWFSVWSKVQSCIWPSRCHCHSLSLGSLKSRLVLPFWYRLTWVVPEKGPLNGCVCVYCELFADIITWIISRSSFTYSKTKLQILAIQETTSTFISQLNNHAECDCVQYYAADARLSVSTFQGWPSRSSVTR